MRIKLHPLVLGDARKGLRNPFAKLVTSVDMSRTNGYAFEGKFLRVGQEIDLPEGSIVLINKSNGSWKYKHNTAYVCRVEAQEPDGSCDATKQQNLNVLKQFDYVGEFLSLRDYLAELVNNEPVNPLATFTDEQILAEAKRRGLL